MAAQIHFNSKRKDDEGQLSHLCACYIVTDGGVLGEGRFSPRLLLRGLQEARFVVEFVTKEGAELLAGRFRWSV